MIVTNRDKRVIEFIDKMNCVSTKTIAELYYPSLRVAQNRLKLMAENKVLKRDRDHITNQYYYYIDKKPKQVNHNLLLTDFYKELSKFAETKVFEKEFSIGELRSDAFVGYRVNNKNYIAFIEVELSNIPDIKKYEELYESKVYKEYFKGVFPLVIFITNKNIPKSYLKIISVDENLDNLKKNMT